MFTTPCIIGNNTPELRERLENLGYKYSGADGETLDYIITFPHKALYSIFDKWHIIKQPKVFSEWIPCRADNEELFLALAALRDDNDYMQWFICDDNKSMFKVDKPNMTMDKFIYNYMDGWNTDGARKATVKEIIEHFKK